MRLDEIETLLSCNSWANAKVLAQVEKLTKAQRHVDPGLSDGSPHCTLVHIIITPAWIWRMRADEGVSPTAVLTANDLPTYAAVMDLW